MNIVVVTRWYGRLGNNVIQLINAIRAGKERGYNCVRFPSHDEFIETKIVFDEREHKSLPDLYDEWTNDAFYWAAIHGNIEMNAREFFQIFLLYIKPIIVFDLTTEKTYECVVHIRGGDTKYSTEYVPFPLAFVNLFWKPSMIVISEDLSIPVAKYLVNKRMARWERMSKDEDMRILSNSKTLGLGYGTFTLIILMYSIINGKLKDLYLPDYVYNRWKDHWKIDVKEILNPETRLHVIDLPGYIKVNEYRYNDQSHKTLIEYKIPT